MLAAMIAAATSTAFAAESGRIGFSGQIVDGASATGAAALRDQALRDHADRLAQGLVPPRDADAVFLARQQAARLASGDGQGSDAAAFAYPLRGATFDGYPAFQLACDLAQDQCRNTEGQVVGTLRAVAEKLPPVRNRDVLRRDWQCDHVCLDATGTVVGAVQAEMVGWLQTHPQARLR